MTEREAFKCVWGANLYVDEDGYPRSRAQPEQEPVEWGVDWGSDGNSVSIIKRLAGGGIEVVGWEYAPHPPQRTWVGLTKKEVYDLYDSDYAVFHQRIEAKLKEKNT